MKSLNKVNSSTLNYIFLNTTIANIGGAELYISHKLEHLEKLGYNVYVITFEVGNVVIENLKTYEKYIIPELKIPFRRTTHKVRKSVINVFLKLNLHGTTIIESSFVNLNLWGEYIASQIKAYHICYLLPETNDISPKDYNFFLFKYNQHCLYGITKNTIPQMMNDGGVYPNTTLTAVGCTADAVNNENLYNIPNWKDADYTILSLGRLNKPYVPYMLAAVENFIKAIGSNTVNLILVGGYINVSIRKKINTISKYSKTINIFYLGEMNPIPQVLFRKSDVAIAVAGCAGICQRQGLPTITIDANDFKAIGILGKTTKNRIYREKEQPIEITELLYKVLVEKEYVKSAPQKCLSRQNIDYSEHDKLLQIPSNYNYYQVSHKVDSYIDFFIKCAICILGCKKYYTMVTIFKRLITK